MKKILAFALIMTMIFALAACGDSSGTGTSTGGAASGTGDSASGYDNVTLKFSYATGDTGMDGIVAIKFEELVEEKSGGVVQIDRYPNCQLSGGDMTRHVEMMIAGGAFELAIISETTFSDVDPIFQVSGIPFIFSSYEEAYAMADSTGGEFSAALLAQYGVVRLDSFSNSIMHFANNKREIRSPDDMVNLKMRTYGDLQMSLMRDLGADPTNMSWSELYSALQTGAVDGNINGYQTLYSASMQEVQPYLTEVSVVWGQYDIMANQAAWDKLSPATQELLQECATEAALYGRQYMNDVESEIRQEFIDYGVTITELTEAEMQAFRDAAAPTIQAYKELAGEEACAAWGIQ